MKGDIGQRERERESGELEREGGGDDTDVSWSDSPNVTPNAMNLISCFAASTLSIKNESSRSRAKGKDRKERKEAEDLLVRGFKQSTVNGRCESLIALCHRGRYAADGGVGWSGLSAF